MNGIKKISSILTVIFTISLLTLMSCDGGSSGTDGTGGTGGGISGDNSLLTTVSGTIVDWGDTSKAPASLFVVAVITHEEGEGEDEETVVDAECSSRGTVGADGSFSITLNSSLAAEYLSAAKDNGHVVDCDFDPTTMTGTWNYDVEFYVYASTKTPGIEDPDFSIEYAVDDTENANSAGLMYSAVKGTISGTTSQNDTWTEEEGDDWNDRDETYGETLTIDSTETNNLNVTLYAGWNWLVFATTFDPSEDVDIDAEENTITYEYVSNISSSTNESLTGYEWYIESYDK